MIETVNEQQRVHWNDPSVASFWPRKEHLTGAVTGQVLRKAGAGPGRRVLEVGSGGGMASLQAAELVGDGGRVVGVDISAPMVALARQRAQEAGVANVHFVEADMQVAHVDGGPFDVAVSQFGVMFFEDPVAAFANVRAHLVPGGRIAFACWRDQDVNPWFSGPALAPYVAQPEPQAPGQRVVGPFAFADASYVVDTLESAGWSHVERSVHEETVAVDADVLLCGEDELVFRGVDPARCSEAQRAVEASLSPFRTDDGRYRVSPGYHVFVAVA